MSLDLEVEAALLHLLPPGHEQRQRPLVGAQIRNLNSKEWREIGPSWAISKACFDQLGEAWTSTSEFRFNTEGQRAGTGPAGPKRSTT